ncbi:MAG: YwmB family TATA-box binding protein [Clostridia bacterium]|nr:YwmB family TATA-box binding protein [Clostridia bacterium]
MFKKTIGIIVILLALFPFFYQPAHSMVYNPPVEDRIYGMLEQSDASPMELNVQGWCKVSNRFMKVEELESLAGRISKKLGARNPEFITENGEDFRQVRGQISLDEDTILSIAAQSLVNFSTPSRREETYLTASIVHRAVPDNRKYWSKVMRASLASAGGERPQVLTNLTGTLPGRLSLDDKNRIAESLFEGMGVQEIQGIKEEGLFSLTGFTPRIRENLKIGNKKVNLNIALRYHSSDGRTYIYIGSPLLVGEY